MNKPIAGIPLRLFQLWLYAPLLIPFYVDYAMLGSNAKVGWIPMLIALGASLFIAGIVLFGREFRLFSRATPTRILIFFGIAFAVTEIFVIALSAIQENLRVTVGLITIPAIYAFIFTPLLVMRCEGWLPKSVENQTPN
jgi:hypothetical protein